MEMLNQPRLAERTLEWTRYLERELLAKGQSTQDAVFQFLLLLDCLNVLGQGMLLVWRRDGFTVFRQDVSGACFPITTTKPKNSKDFGIATLAQ